MTLLGRIAAASALMLFATAALAQSGFSDAAMTSSSSSQARPLHIVKIMPRVSAATISAPAGAHVTYYGGPVISNVQVIVVYWGSSISPTVQNNIPGFYSDVTNGPYLDLLAEYSTAGISFQGTTTDEMIGRGSQVGVFSITPSVSGSQLDDSAIQTEIIAQIQAGNIPAPMTDALGFVNTLYMVHFPLGITITEGGLKSCVPGGFCGYHGTFARLGKDIPYGVLPYMGPGSSCYSSCGGSTELENTTSVSSHELAESITDTGVGLAMSFGPPLAWYDVTNGEIADICNQESAYQTYNGHSWFVQSLFSNLQSNCVFAPSALPPIPVVAALYPAPVSNKVKFFISVPPGQPEPLGQCDALATPPATPGSACYESYTAPVLGQSCGMSSTCNPCPTGRMMAVTGMKNATDNGTFPITRFVNANQIKVRASSGVTLQNQNGTATFSPGCVQ